MERLLYQDRTEAGQRLAASLVAYANCQNALVLALPRGGVPVAYEVARALHVPLDVFLVRKLGVPGQEELALGALASGGIRVLNKDIVQRTGIPARDIDAITAREQLELARREQLYRGCRPFPTVEHRTIILVDDGLATGATMRAAVRAIRQREPSYLIVAVPVAALSACIELGDEADETICLRTPDPFYGVGAWYRNFDQTSDQTVHDLLADAEREITTSASEP
jgi:predicted phosphoribosyltransferase